MICQYCQRDSGNGKMHHTTPRSKGGKTTVFACLTCEEWIHKQWSNNELRDVYNTVESVVNTEEYRKFHKWLLKQPADSVFRSKANVLRNRRRYS